MSRQKNKQKKNIKFDLNFWITISFLLLMVFSIGGFALISSGSSNSNGSSSNGKLPANLAMQLITYNGTDYYVSIKNSKQFVFMPQDVDKYNADLVASGIANRIKNSNNLKIVNYKNFSSPDADFELEKVLTGLQIPFEYSNSTKCEKGTLFLTNNDLDGNCIKFISSNDKAYDNIMAVVYHLVK